MRARGSLAGQAAALLIGAFIAVELLTVLAFAAFMMLPMARRAADDLAGLMALSAQTWAELPPATRPAFELELWQAHGLALRAEPAGVRHGHWHPPFFALLEHALAERTGRYRHLAEEDNDGERWYWVDLPSADGTLTVGLPRQRISSQPLLGAALLLALALLTATGVAVVLARRIARPLSELEYAARELGAGQHPTRLVEDGPRELASLARRFNTLAAQVDDLLSARTTLLAGISHDLRTPLARLRLALELLPATSDDGLQARMAHDIEEMDALIGSLLDLARGLQSEEPTPVELSAFVAQLAADHADSGRAIHTEATAGTWRVPAEALRRATGNLLQNALRYAPDGPIEVRATHLQQGLLLQVLDRGPGIPPDLVEEMFHPFRRLEPSRSAATGGSGLGLAIVRELARANAWQLTLIPREGGGLDARIVVPLAARCADNEANPDSGV